jgi:hypothetical protein
MLFALEVSEIVREEEYAVNKTSTQAASKGAA